MPLVSNAGSKREVRHSLRARRREIAAARDLAADDRAIAAHALAWASSVTTHGRQPVALSYESLPHEPPTTALNRALVAAGWQVLVPITLPDLDLDWHDVTDGAARPLGTDVPAHVDLALIPGLAVDRTGTRLGQGGGCYDRVLPRLREGTPVAVLLHPGEHTGETLPREPHDRPAGTVLTAEGVTPSSARG